MIPVGSETAAEIADLAAHRNGVGSAVAFDFRLDLVFLSEAPGGVNGRQGAVTAIVEYTMRTVALGVVLGVAEHVVETGPTVRVAAPVVNSRRTDPMILAELFQLNFGRLVGRLLGFDPANRLGAVNFDLEFAAIEFNFPGDFNVGIAKNVRWLTIRELGGDFRVANAGDLGGGEVQEVDAAIGLTSARDVTKNGHLLPEILTEGAGIRRRDAGGFLLVGGNRQVGRNNCQKGDTNREGQRCGAVEASAGGLVHRGGSLEWGGQPFGEESAFLRPISR